MLEIVEEEIGSGAVVAGEYRLDEKLGEGGMGVVWRATHLPSGDRCAVKLLKAGRETEPKNQARLAYEARAAMAVEHPNVARVRAVLETEAGAPFIVMDLLDGEPLRDYLQKHTSLDVARCAAIFEGVIAGVRAAHERGVVHRDLKPENVFLTPSGVKVLDFGIAKKLRRDDEDAGPPSLTSTGTVLGTPAYMAPEQLFGERDLDARADVWALGVMLDEALTGVHPFGREMGQVLKAITQGLRRPLGERRPDLPPALCAVVDAMVTRDKRARPSLEDVATVLAGGELAPATAPLPPPTRGAITAPDVPPVTQRTTPGAIGLDSTARALAAPAAPSGPPAIGPSGPPAIAPSGSPPIAPSGPPAGAMRVAGPSGVPTSAPPGSGAEAAAPRPGPRRSAAIALGVAAVVVALAGVTFGAAKLASQPKPEEPGGVYLSAGAALARAQRAYADRRGPECLAALDARDRVEGIADIASTKPSSAHAILRSQCLMLAGRCREGRELANAYHDVHRDPRSTSLNGRIMVERDLALLCDTDELDGRERLARAEERLLAIARGERKGTSADCARWYGIARAEAALVTPLSPEDALPLVDRNLVHNAPHCFAAVGDCAAARDFFAREYLRTRDPGLEPEIRERNMREKLESDLDPRCRDR